MILFQLVPTIIPRNLARSKLNYSILKCYQAYNNTGFRKPIQNTSIPKTISAWCIFLNFIMHR